MSGWFYDDLARRHGFDSFAQWVAYEHTRRRVEDVEFQVKATRLMWGEEAARRVRQEMEEENHDQEISRRSH